MDNIYKALLNSAKPERDKRAVVRRMSRLGGEVQTPEQVNAMLNVCVEFILNGDSPEKIDMSKQVSGNE